jgi:hypothetical protein
MGTKGVGLRFRGRCPACYVTPTLGLLTSYKMLKVKSFSVVLAVLCFAGFGNLDFQVVWPFKGLSVRAAWSTEPFRPLMTKSTRSDTCPKCGGELLQTDKNTFTGEVWREYTSAPVGMSWM